MLLNAVPGWFRIENSALPWYVQQPEHWWYPIQTLICGILLWWWRGQYRLGPCQGNYLLLAGLFALIGIAFWVLPGHLYLLWRLDGVSSDWWKWLGIVERAEGFDLSVLDSHPVEQRISLIFRFLRSTLVVPLVEELCWRGWLMRTVIAEDRPFTRVPFGTHSWKSFWVTTLAVTFIHQPEDYLAAFLWGSLVYALAVRSKSLRACVIMHAVGNLTLGIYILKTGQFGYW